MFEKRIPFICTEVFFEVNGTPPVTFVGIVQLKSDRNERGSLLAVKR